MLKITIVDSSPQHRIDEPDFRFAMTLVHETKALLVRDGSGVPLVSVHTVGGDPAAVVWGQAGHKEPTHTIALLREPALSPDCVRTAAAIARVTPIVHEFGKSPLGGIPGGYAATVRCHERWRQARFVGMEFDFRIDDLTEQEAAAVVELLTKMRSNKRG